jgi:hypothetical protein
MKMKNRIFSLCFFLFCLLSLSSCLNSKRIDKFVTKHYETTPPPKKVKPVENIIISSPLSIAGPQSVTTGKTYNWLPLIVYIEFHYAMTCTLNPEHAITVYSNSIHKYAAKKLSKNLGNKQLKLSIEKIPQQFQVLDEGHMIFIGLAVAWDKITIGSVDKTLEVRYQLLENGVEISSGTLSESMPDYLVRVRPTVKQQDIAAYFSNYEKNITILSQRMADQLERELQLVNQ